MDRNDKVVTDYSYKRVGFKRARLATAFVIKIFPSVFKSALYIYLSHTTQVIGRTVFIIIHIIYSSKNLNELMINYTCKS